MKVGIKKLPHAQDLPLPHYATQGSAGLDLLAAIDADIELKPGARMAGATGIAIQMPLGGGAQGGPRSGPGRLAPAAVVARLPGFSTSLTRGTTRSPDFLTLELAMMSGRQSDTAAAITSTSAGRAASQAARISRAVGTRWSFTPSGGALDQGPEIRGVHAPGGIKASAGG